VRTIIILAIFSLSLLGQGAGKLQFEAASIKPASPERALPLGAQAGGPGTPDPGQIKYANLSLKDLIFIAYAPMPYQIDMPASLEEDRFDIVAKLPAGVSKSDVPAMLQVLLEERFQLMTRHVSRESQAYVLTLLKSGPKLREYPLQLPDDIKQSAHISGVDNDGIPIISPGYSTGMMGSVNGRTYISIARQPIQNLCRFLSKTLQRPVVDQTGLAGRYDLRLLFEPEGLPSADGDANPAAGARQALEPEPTLFQAVQDQLGMRLEARKTAVDFLVVEHALRRPVGN
jgi:uncharacterized protein (TIGR03435 family)